MTTTKTRSDSVLDRMPAVARERLDEWLHEGRSYAEVLRLLAGELGVESSRSALGRYYARWIAPQRMMAAVVDAARLTGGAADTAVLVEAARGLMAQQLFEALAQPRPEVGTAGRLAKAIATIDGAKIAEKRVELQERVVAVRERLAGVKEVVAGMKVKKMEGKAQAVTERKEEKERGAVGEAVMKEKECGVVASAKTGVAGAEASAGLRAGEVGGEFVAMKDVERGGGAASPSEASLEMGGEMVAFSRDFPAIPGCSREEREILLTANGR